MTRRLYWVAMTYVTHPLSWFYFAFAIVFLTVGIFLESPVSLYVFPSFDDARPSVRNADELARALHEGWISKVEYFGVSFLPFTFSSMGTRGESRIYVSDLENTQGRFIEIDEILKQTPDLRILEILDLSLNERTLRAITKLPKLECIGVQGSSSNEEIIALSKIPTLRTVYVNHRGNDGVFDLYRQRLGRLDIRHAELNSSQVLKSAMVVASSLWISTLCLTMISIQFRLPCSRVIPRFAAAHLIVPLSVAGIWIAIASLCLARSGGNPLPTWAILSAIMGLIQCIDALGVKPNASHVRLRQCLGLIGVLVLIAGATSLWRFHLRFLGEFLLGNLPWTTWCVLVAGVSLFLVCLRFSLNPMHAKVDLAKYGIEPDSHGDANGVGISKRWKGFLARNPDSQVKRFETVTLRARWRGSLFDRLSFWRLGNEMDLVAPFAITFAILLIVASGAINDRNRQDFSMTDFLGILASLTAFFSFIWWVSTLNAWRQRMELLSFEILHPIGRRDTLRELQLAIAWDHLRIFVFSLVPWLVFGALHVRNNDTPVEQTFAVLLVIAGLYFVTAAASLWLVVAIQDWRSVLVMVLAACWLFGSVIFFVARIATPENNATVYLFAAALELWLCSLLAYAFAFRQWSKIELGLYG